MSDIKKEEKKEEKPKEDVKKEVKKEVKLNFIDKIFKYINDGLIGSKISSGELMLIILYITEGFVAATITAKTSEVHPAVRILLHLIAAIISVYAGLNMIPSMEDIFKTIQSSKEYNRAKFVLKLLFDTTESLIYTIIALTSPFLVFMLIASGLDQMDRVQYLFNTAGIFNVVQWFSVLNYTLNGTYLAMIFHYMLLLVVAIGYGKKYIKKEVKIEPAKEGKTESKVEEKKEEPKVTEESKPKDPIKLPNSPLSNKPKVPNGLIINQIVTSPDALLELLQGLVRKYEPNGSMYDKINSNDKHQAKAKILAKLEEFHNFLKVIFDKDLPYTQDDLLNYILKGKMANGKIPTIDEVLQNNDHSVFNTISSDWFNNTYLQSIKSFSDKLMNKQDINKHFLQPLLAFSNSVLRNIEAEKKTGYRLPGTPDDFKYVEELIIYTNEQRKK